MSNLSEKDRNILRKLAEEKLRISQDPVNLERKTAWYKLDAGDADCRPMILAETGGVKDEKVPFSPELECEDEWARRLEMGLKGEIWQFENLKDDHIVEPFLNVPWQVKASDYGVEVVQHTVDNVVMGARTWDHPLQNLDADFNKLKPREFSVKRQATYDGVTKLESVFSGILPVRIRGAYWWTLGMTIQAINFIGLENLMLYMFDNPEGLHRLMTFLRDDHLAYAEWLENEELLCLNNENDYIGSGSMGYTYKLPQTDCTGKVRMKDQWVLLESQETVGVGPEQFEEFIFPYQKDIAEKFGKVYYGCCEPVHTRWQVLEKMPNLARVSVSPWADENFMAEALGRDYVYSRKPNPTLISTGRFDEDEIRQDIRNTLAAAGNCRLEIIMKDVHTLNNEPERISRWVEIAREEVG